MENKLSIIIVNWNTSKLLMQCVNSVVQSSKCLLRRIEASKVQSEIIVVDNGSSDGSDKALGEYIENNSRNPTIKLIKNRTNLGFAKGNNIGIRKARGEYIMLLNSDTIVKEGSIEKLAEFLDSHSDVDIVGPRLLNSDGTSQSNCGRFPDLWVTFVMLFKERFGGSNLVRTSPNESKEVDWLMGAAFMARRAVFEKVGGLDEDIFMYMEEVEWFYRAKKNGFKTYFYKDAEITHLGMGSSKSGRKDPILNIYKGLLNFYKKHKSPWEIFLLLIMLKIKAFIALMVGIIFNNNYLKETYGQALKIS